MRTIVMLVLVSLAACSGKHAVRVDCDGRLSPINGIAPEVKQSAEDASHSEESKR